MIFDFVYEGLDYYVKRIEAGPFSLIKYGDGEWKKMSGIPLTAWQQVIFSKKSQCDILRRTITHCYRSPRYVMATCHQKGIRKWGHGKKLRKWIDANVPPWVQWYEGHVFRRAARHAVLFPLVEAIFRQPLPVVFVGPPILSQLKLPGPFAHIVTPAEETCPEAWYGREKIEEKIRNFGEPAFFSFTVGSAAKIMIHDLWPRLGKHCYLIDFGSLWEGLCGHHIRHYHRFLTPEVIRKNLTGKW